jgi:hypothetical protein
MADSKEHVCLVLTKFINDGSIYAAGSGSGLTGVGTPMRVLEVVAWVCSFCGAATAAAAAAKGYQPR